MNTVFVCVCVNCIAFISLFNCLKRYKTIRSWQSSNSIPIVFATLRAHIHFFSLLLFFSFFPFGFCKWFWLLLLWILSLWSRSDVRISMSSFAVARAAWKNKRTPNYICMQTWCCVLRTLSTYTESDTHNTNNPANALTFIAYCGGVLL